MPQKPVIKGKKIDKKQAANKHGKTGVTKKARPLDIAPRKRKLLEKYKEDKEITKLINANNESVIAGKAENAGGKLKALKAPPPVFAPKGATKKSKEADKGNAMEDD